MGVKQSLPSPNANPPPPAWERRHLHGAMPATAGRVRMPHNNVMSTSAALKSSAVWQNVIGYDPYAPEAGAPQGSGAGPSAGAAGTVRTDGSAYENMKGLMALAKMTGGADETKGTWRGRGKLRAGWLSGEQVPLNDDGAASGSSGTDSEEDSVAGDAHGGEGPAAARAPTAGGSAEARPEKRLRDEAEDRRRHKAHRSDKSSRKKSSRKESRRKDRGKGGGDRKHRSKDKDRNRDKNRDTHRDRHSHKPKSRDRERSERDRGRDRGDGDRDRDRDGDSRDGNRE